jgi:hypothetical protein
MECEDASQTESGMQSFLDLDPPSTSPAEEVGAHDPITDFVLHVANGLQSAEVLKNWPPANSTNHSFHVGGESGSETASLREEFGSTNTSLLGPRRKVRYFAKKPKGATQTSGKTTSTKVAAKKVKR